MTKLYPYQKVGVLRVNRFRGRALIADEMGLGKSIQALTWIHRFRKSRRTLPAIVVCPASLKWNWEDEAFRHIRMQAEVLEGTKVPQRTMLKRKSLIIINYDILGPWLSVLRQLGPRTIVVDEAHFIKNRQTARSKAVRALCEGVPYVLPLSGTPLTNRPAELWPILNLVRPDLYPSFFSYAMKHCKPERKPWGWEYKGAEKLDELHTDLRRTMMVRRLKKNVLKDLPAKSRHVFPIRLSGSDHEEYEMAERDIIRWLRRWNPARVPNAARAERLVRMGYLKRLSAQLKLPTVINWIDDYLQESESKLALFGIHKVILKALWERYRHQCVVVNGSVTTNKRRHAVQTFQTNRRCRLFLGNIQAAGVGLNLTAAHTMAFVELGWTPGEHTQAEDRIHRIGQKDGASCFYLIARGTIEEYLCELIQRKQEILDQALDGQINGQSLDIFTRLHRNLLDG